MFPLLQIVFQDDHLVAINKPSGLLVHRSPIDRHETRFAVQMLRDQLGQKVYPVHRLDKPTSGILVFALSPDTARELSTQWPQFHKTYIAVVRGWTEESGDIDHAFRDDDDPHSRGQSAAPPPVKEALTHYRRLATIELPVAIERYPQSRYSLVLCQPKTGRRHQLRRHMKHIGHPIIGDAKHGRGRHNRYFKDQLDAGRLLLHATQLQLSHPHSDDSLTIDAPVDICIRQLLSRFDWLDALPSQWHTAPPSQ